MGRRGLARDCHRGGEDVQAARQAGTRVGTALAAFACATALAALALVRAEDQAALDAGWRISAVGLLALVAALVLGWTVLVPVALGALGGWYGLQLAVDDAPLDLAAPLVAAGLVVTAELAYWSLEERERVEGEPGGTLRRLAYAAALAFGTFVVSGFLLALVDGVRLGGLAIDLVGAAAAAGALVAIVLAAARRGASDR